MFSEAKEIVLRPYQEQAIENLRVGIRQGYKNQLLCAPTGSGKTILAAHLIKECYGKTKKAVFVVDRINLVDQTSATFDTYGIPHGVMQASHWRHRPWERVQICSAQTLSRRTWPDADLIVVDECHTISKVVKDRISPRDTITIGLTATPFTKGLGKVYDRIINVTATQKLIDDGFLSNFRIFACEEPNMEGVRTKNGGEWVESEASKRSLEVVGDCIKEYLNYANGKKFICSACDTAHVEALYQQFMDAGVVCANYTYKVSDEERTEIIKEFRKPDSYIRGIITVTAATKGFDCLSEDTEILTPDGWKGIGQIAVGDQVYGFNRDTEKVEIVPVEAYGERPLKEGERMVSIKSQRFDIRVSEGHELHYKYRTGHFGKRSDDFKTSTAAEMVGRKQNSYLPTAGECDFPGIPLTDDEIRLVAWFMTDGSKHRQTFSISQSKPYKHEIRNLLNRLGLDFKEYERPAPETSYRNAKPFITFNIPKGTSSGSMKRNGWGKYAPYLDKKVSKLLFNMTKHQFRVLWDELLKGNGAKQQGKSGWLWCPYKEQADAFTHMAVVRGYSANYLTEKTKSGYIMYAVSVRDARYLMTAPSSPIGAKFVFEEPKPDEKVWCIKNRLSTIITRRNGRVVILGNCPDVECVIMARPLRKSLAEHIQFLGRGLRPHPGKKECIVLDHSGNCLRFMDDMVDFFQNGCPELDDGKVKERKKPKEKENTEDKYQKCPNCKCLHNYAPVCPNCGHVYPPKPARQHKPGSMKELILTGARKELTQELWPQIIAYAKIYKTPERQRGFALAMFKNITKMWPDTPYEETEPAETISPFVMGKIKQLNIAYAHAMKKKQQAGARA